MKYSVEYWRSRLEQHVDFGDPSRDVDRMEAWLTEESGGNPAALGAVYEVGIFQLDLQDGPAWGASIATLHGNFTASATSQTPTRDLTDAEEELQVTSGLAYVKHARAVALQQISSHGMTWSDDDTWCLSKLHHGLPVLVSAYFNTFASSNGNTGTWSDFRDYVNGLSLADSQKIYANAARYMKNGSFDWLFDNAEKVGYLDGPDGGGSATSIVLGALLLVALFLLAR